MLIVCSGDNSHEIYFFTWKIRINLIAEPAHSMVNVKTNIMHFLYGLY